MAFLLTGRERAAAKKFGRNNQAYDRNRVGCSPMPVSMLCCRPIPTAWTDSSGAVVQTSICLPCQFWHCHARVADSVCTLSFWPAETGHACTQYRHCRAAGAVLHKSQVVAPIVAVPYWTTPTVILEAHRPSIHGA